MIKRIRFTVWAWMAGAAACAAGLASLAALWPQGPDVALSTGTLIAQAVLSAAAIPFFLQARHHFRGQFRHIYVMLGVGVGLLGIAQLQALVVSVTDFLFWVDSGLIGVLFVTATILIFLSMRQFARALHLKTHWTSLGWVGVVAFFAAVLAGALPFLPGVRGDEYSPVMAFSAWNATLAVLAALLVAHMAHAVSGIYTVALTRLNAALLFLAFASSQYIVAAALFPYDSWVFTYGIINIAFIVVGGMFLWSGVGFNLIGESSPERTGNERPTSLNIITYAASLASDQDGIDDILDGVRQISAVLAPGEVPDEQLQHQLAAIYLQLEEYLVAQETLQNFTTASLRERIETTLGLDPTDMTTFWPIITGRAFDAQPAA